EPSAGFSKLAAVTLSASPSTSLSFASTSMLASAVLIGVEALSARAIGASLTAVTVIDCVTAGEASPSSSTALKLIDVLPFQSGFGVNVSVALLAVAVTVLPTASA